MLRERRWLRKPLDVNACDENLRRERTLGRADLRVEPRLLRRGLLDNGYAELPVTSQHAVSLDALPPLHKDLFDRLLLAQATVEGITLLTTDAELARYPGPVRKV